MNSNHPLSRRNDHHRAIKSAHQAQQGHQGRPDPSGRRGHNPGRIGSGELGQIDSNLDTLGVPSDIGSDWLGERPAYVAQEIAVARRAPVERQVLLGAGLATLPAPATSAINIKRWINPSWLKDFNTFMALYGRVGAIDRERICSKRTLELRKEVLESTFRALAERVRGVRTLSQFTPRYIPQVLAAWSEPREDGEMRQKPSTQVANFTVLRWFWSVHGIATEPIKHYVQDPKLKKLYQRETVANTDKSWTGTGIDVDNVIELAKEEDVVLARLLTQAKEFGLRAKESLNLDPNESDGGDHLRVLRGAKGGRQRVVQFEPFGDASLRKVLDELRTSNPAGIRAWEGLTMGQARKRLYYLLGKIGVTRKGMGITMHGLRTEFAIKHFEELSGVSAPVRNGSVINYRELDEVRRRISEALGHNRVRVTGAYYGSFDKMAKLGRGRFMHSWSKLQDTLPQIQTLVLAHGLQNLWLVGAIARGEAALATSSFEFLIDLDGMQMLENTSALLHFMQALRQTVEPVLGCTAVIHIALPDLDMEALTKGAVPLLQAAPPNMVATLVPNVSGA